MNTPLFRNERDIEVPALLHSITNTTPSSLLDVGAHYSYFYYADQVNKIMQSGSYDAIDQKYCELTELLVDDYYTKDVLVHRKTYDYVSCVSMIEHSGIKKGEIQTLDELQQAQIKVFTKLTKLAKQTIFITFPFGDDYVFPGEYANITKEQLTKFNQIADKAGFINQKQSFFWSENSTIEKPFISYTIDEYNTYKNTNNDIVRSICITEYRKG